MRLFLTLFLFVSFLAQSQVYYYTDFESQPLGTAYERSVWQADGFNTGTWDNGLVDRTWVTNSTSISGTQSLQIEYPADNFGTSNTGCQVRLEFSPQDEVYSSYNLKFSENFTWGTTNYGGKLPGLAGGDNCSGGDDCSSGTVGFTCRLMWRAGGKAVLYLYHMDKPGTYGEDIDLHWPEGGEVTFIPGEWYHITERVKINTDGSTYDGEVQIWVNGKEVLHVTGIRFTSNGDKVDNLYISSFHGGGDATWSPTTTCHTYIDDVTISSNYEDVAYVQCKGPDLGVNTSLCGTSSVTLNANVSTTNASFSWVKDGAPIGGANSDTYIATQAGEYVVIYDSLGCVMKDTITVASNLNPDLGTDRVICATSFETLNAQDMGVGYSYAWTQDGSPIEGATESTFDAYQAGTYGVTISASGCADASSTVTLTTNFLNVPDVSGAENDVVTVTIHESGSFGWYNQENGGSQLGTGTTYDATVGASDYFLYVQDETGFVASVGKTLAPTTWTDNRFERMMKFETYTELNIDAITVYAVAEQDITINVLASDELTVVATKTFTNAPPGANRLQLDFNIPTAGTYYMSAEGSTGELEYSYEADTDISFPYTITDKISILGSNETWIDAKPYYLFFYDWQVSAGNTCARTPVKIESTGVTSNIIEIEAENATLHGVTVANSTPGYSGTGYVNGMDTDGDYIEFSINLSEGTYYKLDVTYNGGEKYQKLYVNSVLIDNIHYPATTGFETIEAASSILLQAGDNTIKIEKDWGWTDFDKITLTEIAPPEPIDYSTLTTTLIDSQANAKTYAVYNYLCSQYGENIISGQIDNFDPLVAVAGETPVIRAWDFQHYTVGYSYLWDNDIGGHVFGWEDDGSTQEAIDWYTSTNGKGIVSFQWHWHSPSGGTISTNTFTAANTTFDVGLAVQNGTIEHTEILRDIDSIATQLKKLEAAGVPVLWRPLHEAGGQWFWWGAGSATECLALWDIVYDRLTNYHNIHNLIWVWSTPEEDWYPGNSKVDIIGYDSYPGEYNYVTQKQKFDQLYEIVGGEKLVAMTENGPIPNPDDCISEDAMWSFFASWNDLVTEQNTTQHIQDVYAHNNVIVLDEVIPIVLQNITLEAGWNLISTNVHPSDSTIETLFSGLDVNMIKNADSFWKAGQDINLNSLTKITSGKAYLVKMNVGGTLSIIGTEQTLHTTSVASGWQMMGCQYQTATSFTTDFNATNTTIIKNFDGFWEPERALNSITDLEPGKGYFVKGK